MRDRLHGEDFPTTRIGHLKHNMIFWIDKQTCILILA